MTLWQHPNFFAYFPTACTFEGVLGDLYSTSTPNPGFNVRYAATPVVYAYTDRTHSGLAAPHAPNSRWR